jgi:hypothetical protein
LQRSGPRSTPRTTGCPSLCSCCTSYASPTPSGGPTLVCAPTPGTANTACTRDHRRLTIFRSFFFLLLPHRCFALACESPHVLG